MKKSTTVKEPRSIESIISLFLGIAVVLIVGVLLFNYFRGMVKGLISKKSTEKIGENVGIEETFQETPSGEAAETPFKPPENLPTRYKVQKDDSLWKISLKFYGSGYNWVDISEENKLADSNLLDSNQVLTIPNVPPKLAQKKVKTTQTLGPAIEGDKYTVQKGDNLWKISVRAYQDGYKWPEIAKTNNLSNPDIIHPGNVLTIPR